MKLFSLLVLNKKSVRSRANEINVVIYFPFFLCSFFVPFPPPYFHFPSVSVYCIYGFSFHAFSLVHRKAYLWVTTTRSTYTVIPPSGLEPGNSVLEQSKTVDLATIGNGM